MKNTVGKNIAKLRKERGLSQEQLAGELHVTRQAVSNWETGRSQPDLETLETLAGIFQTDILVVIYGQLPPKEDEEIRAAERKRHLRLTAILGICAVAGYLITAMISGRLYIIRRTTYNSMPYIIFNSFVRPVIYIPAGMALMHGLNLFGTVRIPSADMKRRLLVWGVLMIPLYVAVLLWIYGFMGPAALVPMWMWKLPESMFPVVLYFIIGMLLYLGHEA